MKNNLPNIIFEGYAMLAYLNNEPGAQQVQDALKNAAGKKCRILVSEMTLGDVVSITEREVGLVKAQEILAVMEQLPITIVQTTDRMTMDAAHLRSHFHLSIPGSFAAVLALDNNATLYTGDPEYKAVQDKIKIEWLSSAQEEAQPEKKTTTEKINLRSIESDNDFEEMAVLFTIEEDFVSTQKSLKEEFERKKQRVVIKIAEDEHKTFLGFYWIAKSEIDLGRAYLYLIVKPEMRRRGAGGRLMNDAMEYVLKEKLTQVRVPVRDDAPDSLAFAEHHGFKEYKHQISMELDLTTFDFHTYDGIINNLKAEGFMFTNMAEQGDTAEAQRKLYELNESTAMDTMGSDGSRTWKDFEDFQKNVCQTSWYKPEGQKVVIDKKTGKWAAMCAIGLFDGQGYNLHTGVNRAYRGRKLAQAVKVTGLLYARDVLKVKKIFTHHNTGNEPMLAIDRKFGYTMLPGTYTMEKLLS